jgi:hypothetical protein
VINRVLAQSLGNLLLDMKFEGQLLKITWF